MSLEGTKPASASKTILVNNIQKYINIIFAIALPVLLYFGIEISEDDKTQLIANVSIVLTAVQSLYNLFSAEISSYYRKKATQKIEG